MSYKRGLISKDQMAETTVTDEEIQRVSDLYHRVEQPLTGFEIHLLNVLSHDSIPLTPKEKALVNAFKDRHGEFSRSYGYEIKSNLTSEQMYENNAILSEMWGDVESSAQSEESGWIYDEHNT